MAIGATIYKAKITVSDLRRHYYAEHTLTVACHPSETEQRMMLRLLSFALYANENLTFGKGVSSADEPDLWLRNKDETIDTWITLGQPDIKQVKKACHRSKETVIICYGDAALKTWWSKYQKDLSHFNHLHVFHINTQHYDRLQDFAEKNLSIVVNIDEDDIFLSNEKDAFNFQLTKLK